MAYGHNRTTKNRSAWQVREPKVRPETNARERVDLNPEAFDRVVTQKGVIAKIFRTTYCPNVKSVDGAEHEIDCTLCNGSGWFDSDPICVPVLIQHQELEKLPQVEGFVDGNTVMMTFPVGIELQYFTKIELHDHTGIYIQRVLRKPASLTDVLKYPACRVNVVVGKDGKRYYQDSDYRIDHNGNIVWLTAGDIQKIAFSDDPDGGSFTVTFDGNTSVAIAWDDDETTVQNKIRALDGLEAVTVAFDAGTILVTMVGVDSPVALLTTTSLLTHLAAPVTITVTDVSKSAKKPNDDVPYSIHYEAKVVYRAALAIHASRFTQYTVGSSTEHIKMPEQWYAKKEFLVKRTDKFDGTELQQGPYDNHEIVDEPKPDTSEA